MAWELSFGSITWPMRSPSIEARKGWREWPLGKGLRRRDTVDAHEERDRGGADSIRVAQRSADDAQSSGSSNDLVLRGEKILTSDGLISVSAAGIPVRGGPDTRLGRDTDSRPLAKIKDAHGDRRWSELGVHVIGEQATEIVHIGLMAMLSESGAEWFNQARFNYPSLGDLYEAATNQAMLHVAGQHATEAS